MMQTPNPTSFSWKELFHRLFPSGNPQKNNPFPSLSHPHGIILGVNPETSHLLVYDGPENVLLVGPSRSGKGIGTVIPTALAWENSAVFFDSTGALWERTSGYRKRTLHQKVIKFAPLGAPGETLQWNPFAEIRVGTMEEDADTRLMATCLLDLNPAPRTEREQAVFQHHVEVLANVIHLLVHREQERGSFPSFIDLLAVVETSDSSFYGLTKAEQAYIRAALCHYRNPDILRNTTCWDFTTDAILNAPQPVSFYLVSSISGIQTAQPVMRLFLSFFHARLLEREQADEANRLLLVLDDFLHLGHMPELPQLLLRAPKLGFQCLLTAHSIEAIEGCYLDTRYLLDSCKVQVYHKPDGPATAARIARLLEAYTEKTQPAILENIQTMSSNTEYLFLSACQPVLADRFRYYLHPELVSDTELPPASVYPEPEECPVMLS